MAFQTEGRNAHVPTLISCQQSFRVGGEDDSLCNPAGRTQEDTKEWWHSVGQRASADEGHLHRSGSRWVLSWSRNRKEGSDVPYLCVSQCLPTKAAVTFKTRWIMSSSVEDSDSSATSAAVYSLQIVCLGEIMPGRRGSEVTVETQRNAVVDQL